MFERDTAGCDRLTLQQWKQRGPWRRTQELVAAFLEEQI
jgi:hypothetical protein